MPPLNSEQLNAVREVKSLIQSYPREAPGLLTAVVERYKEESKQICALEARRYQCFAFMGNLQYEEARQYLDTLISEANEANERRFIGIAEMYLGIIAMELGECNDAVEFFEHAIQIGTELEDVDLIYRVQMNLGYAQSMTEQYEEALESFKLSVRHFDVDEAFVTNAPIFYNIAHATIHLALKAFHNDLLQEDQVDQAKKSLEIAQHAAYNDCQLTTLTEILGCILIGIQEGAEAGLEKLASYHRVVYEDSIVSTSITYRLAECRLLELAKDWPRLCEVSLSLLAEMKRARSTTAIQSVLRLSARAHAQKQEFEQAYDLLLESLHDIDRIRTASGERRAQMMNLRQDLERQKFDQEVLRMRNKTLVERNKILEQEARFDPLSGLLNRRGTEEALQQYTERRFADRFAIALLDIDHFKKVNDQFGHAIGDLVIQEFSNCLTNSATNPSKLGRWGGEEFLVVFDISDDREMDMLARTLIEEIRGLNWDHIEKGFKVTASCGLSMWHRGESLDNAIRIADDLLYAVKHQGRNNWRSSPIDHAA